MIRVWVVDHKRTANGRRVTYRQLKWRENGKDRRKSLGRATGPGKVTKAQAREAARKLEKKLNEQTAAAYAGKRLMLSELDRARAESEDTHGDMRLSTRHFIAACGDLYLDEITPQHVVDLKRWLRKRPGLAGRKSVSPATVNKTLRALRALFNWGKRQGFVSRRTDNPFSAQPIPKTGAKEPRIFERKEVAAMERVLRERVDADGKRAARERDLWQFWLVFLRLAVRTGLRRNELLHLRWQDVSLARDGEWVKVCEHDGPIKWKPKAEASKRSVPLDADTATLLREQKVRTRGDYVFGTPQRGNLWRQFRGIQRDAGIERFGSLHDLRKTYCTELASNGIPMHVTRELAGHSTISTTANYYLAVTADDAERVRRLVAAM